MRAKKRYGQNFLIDYNIVEKIIRVAGVSNGDRVLEIGPGEGVMTEALLRAGCVVVAVEIDAELITGLEHRFADVLGQKLRLLHGDILKVDLEELLDCPPRWHVIANLPYYITTPILFKLMNSGSMDVDGASEGVGAKMFESITVMVQKEVAERMVAKPGGRDYGALTVAVNFHTIPKIAMSVPPSVFRPRPSVESAVVRMLIREKPEVETGDDAVFFRVVRASFEQRRKMLRNALISGFSGVFSADALDVALSSVGIDGRRRGETLSIFEFAAISQELTKKQPSSHPKLQLPEEPSRLDELE